ncbi:beta-defensin 130B [Antechinus flavipes]|uniref:beta-defensin 130B n=1 Tax=Antechinus flavipes TaxID=38775 RepID=UPI002236AE0B|nr:beta-defensin 130B [Antechinus flavipes]
MKIMFLFSVLFLFVALLPPGRRCTTRIPAKSFSFWTSKICLTLHGICRKQICNPTEQTIGQCSKKKKCCRFLWIKSPV